MSDRDEFEDWECAECGHDEVKKYPGEHGYGEHIVCDGCGFPIDYR